jgi:hypothetical protein
MLKKMLLFSEGKFVGFSILSSSFRKRFTYQHLIEFRQARYCLASSAVTCGTGIPSNPILVKSNYPKPENL